MINLLLQLSISTLLWKPIEFIIYKYAVVTYIDTTTATYTCILCILSCTAHDDHAIDDHSKW